MDWWNFLWAATCAVAMLGAPGALAGLALRLRGLWLAATAPVMGVSLIALASVISPALGVHWAPWVVMVFAILISAVLLGLASLVPALRGRITARTRAVWIAPTAVGLAALLLGIRVILAIGQPTWFDQAGDNIFHLNAVRWILDHGDASPSGVAKMSPGTAAYPSAWHAIVALTCQLSGASIPVATNAVFFVVACAVWPLGAVLLSRALFGGRAPLLIGAGLASASFAMYPLMLLPYMGTYPLILSIALLPAVLATLVVVVRRLPEPGSWTALIVAAICGPGIADSHPSAAVMLVALAAPIVIVGLWSWSRTPSGRVRLAVLLAILYVAIVLAVLVIVRPAIVQPDSPRMSAAQAIGELLLGAYGGQDVAIALAAATIVGVVVAARAHRSGDLIALGLWAAASFVYLAASSHDEFFRLVLSQPWYGDATRVAAFIPLTVVPLAARGADCVWRSVQTRLDFRPHPRRRPLFAIAAVGFAALVAVQFGPATWAVFWTNQMFTPTDNGLISPLAIDRDDRKVFAYVDEHVPRTDLIAGNPWSGASLAYALTGRPVLVTHLLAQKPSSTMTFLDSFSTSAASGPGCRAARELGVKWVLDLHPDKVMPNRPKLPGVANLAESPNASLVYRSGNSALYKVTGCGVG
ncbi:DUF6541 family protein [Microbacterium sp. ASV49]|uniref:Transmembrane protein alanine and leucine rich n=1 Tax=Microbacterium candidum TaxID=3041922 RepID=A0ABT7N4C5_9MICO|nr:DUF6541 family protein [Microbacterium sp. ASV49]MDL9981549.1 hypothetical protein [Microbacterium sp. ASV49]